MKPIRLLTLAVLIFAAMSFAAPTRALACIWDRDTIAMERERFPEAQELIAGLFVRHSSAYYRWRIDDRQATPLDQHTPADYDDIAVAHDKLGQHDQAIETIRAKIQRWPDEGRYESQANLGTFLIHAGRFEEGLAHIEKAIEINPEAHFGREVYQKLLVEYVLAVRAAEGDQVLPLQAEGRHLLIIGDEDVVLPDQKRPEYLINFPSFLFYTQAIDQADRDAELDRAVKGVLGMMRFGHHDSPILLEALGDLMLAVGLRNDAKMLAARAYLKASYAADDTDASAAYRVMAQSALAMHDGVTIVQVETELKQEIAQGDAFFAQIEADERAWAQAGKDLDAEFAAKYYQEPALKVAGSIDTPFGRLWLTSLGPLIFVAAALALCLVMASCIVIIVRAVKRKRRRQLAATAL